MELTVDLGDIEDNVVIDHVITITKIVDLETGAYSLLVRGGDEGSGLEGLEMLGMIQLAGAMMTAAVLAEQGDTG